MSRTIYLRNIYVRITEDGKRKYVRIGGIGANGKIQLDKGMPLTGWFEVGE